MQHKDGERTVLSIFSTRGRYGRLEYLGIIIVQWIMLFLTFMIAGATLVTGMAGYDGASGGAPVLTMAMMGIIVVAGVALSIWVGFCAIVKRTRDAGWSVKLVTILYAISWIPVAVATLSAAFGGFEAGLATYGSLAVLATPTNIALMIFNFCLFFKGSSPDLPPRGLAEWQGRNGASTDNGASANSAGMEAALEAMIAKRRQNENLGVGDSSGGFASAAAASSPGGGTFAAQPGLGLPPARRGGFGKRNG